MHELMVCKYVCLALKLTIISDKKVNLFSYKLLKINVKNLQLKVRLDYSKSWLFCPTIYTWTKRTGCPFPINAETATRHRGNVVAAKFREKVAEIREIGRHDRRAVALHHQDNKLPGTQHVENSPKGDS